MREICFRSRFFPETRWGAHDAPTAKLHTGLGKEEPCPTFSTPIDAYGVSSHSFWAPASWKECKRSWEISQLPPAAMTVMMLICRAIVRKQAFSRSTLSPNFHQTLPLHRHSRSSDSVLEPFLSSFISGPTYLTLNWRGPRNNVCYLRVCQTTVCIGINECWTNLHTQDSGLTHWFHGR